ncbi:Unknown protein, partial [Striga hermonthica]
SDVVSAIEQIKHRPPRKEDYEACASTFSRSTIAVLDEMMRSLNGAKYVFFPVVKKIHFYLLVLNIPEMKFVYHNSMDNAAYRGIGKSL